MYHGMEEMMWGAWLIWGLVIIVLLLAAAALIKYLFLQRQGIGTLIRWSQHGAAERLS